MVMLSVGLVGLAGCGNSSDDSSAMLDKPSQNSDTAQHTNDDSTVNALNTDSTIKDNDEENSSTNDTEASLKKEYLQKLNATKKETEELEPTDSSTYALKKVENDRWEIWDELLNEIYVVLEEHLTLEEIDQLRDEQRNWIKYRDDRALEASLKYEGGTQEHLEYVAVLANLTEGR